MNNIIKVMEDTNILSYEEILELDSSYEYNGIKVPRVTAILSAMLHEDYLMKWSNSIGLYQKKKYEDTLQDAADKGTYVHEAINRYLLTNELLDVNTLEFATNDQKKAAYNGFYSFLKWWDSVSNILKVEATEMEIVCPYFGGTCDFLVSKNDKIYLLDFKTSKQTGYKHFLQLSAYKFILENYYGIKIHGVGILLLSKNKINVEEYILDLSNPQNELFIQQATQTFLSIVFAYYNRLKTENMFNSLYFRRG